MKKVFNKMVLAAAILLAGALFSADTAFAEKFTLIVMPDTQVEVADNPTIIVNSMNWIVNNQAAKNIKFVCHEGDLTNFPTAPSNDFGHQPQWVNASTCFDILDGAGIPYAICTGNHDTMAVGNHVEGQCPTQYNGGSAACGDTTVNLRDTKLFNYYFPRSRTGFSKCTAVCETGKMENSCHIFSAGGYDWLVLTLEFQPRQAVLDWAKTIIASHPNHNVLIDIHYYIDVSGLVAGSQGYGDKTPKDVRDQLVLPYSNVRFVFNGHTAGAKRIVSTGAAGNKVYQLMFAHQTTWEGWMRVMEIDPANGSFTVKSYSPTLNQYKTDAENEFSYTGAAFIPPSGGGSIDYSPSVSITAPAAGAHVAGTVSVAATATDDKNVAKVEFYLDNVLRKSVSSSPFAWSWDTTAETNASHSLRATAYDTANQTASSQVNVTVDNSSAGPVDPVTPAAAVPFANTTVGPIPFSPATQPAGMAFHNVGANSTLNIFTLAGRRVATLIASSGDIQWNGLTSQNANVTPGIYVYVLTDAPGNKKTGKIVIQ